MFSLTPPFPHHKSFISKLAMMVCPSVILGAVFGFALCVNASPAAYRKRTNRLGVQGHRGGLGYRPESKCSNLVL